MSCIPSRSSALGLAAAFCFDPTSENNEKNLCYLAWGITTLYGYCFALWFLIRWTCVVYVPFQHENWFLNSHSWCHGARDSKRLWRYFKNVFQLYHATVEGANKNIQLANEAEEKFNYYTEIFFCKSFCWCEIPIACSSEGVLAKKPFFRTKLIKFTERAEHSEKWFNQLIRI